VIKENTVAQVHSVGFALVDQDPKCVLLRNSIQRARIERSRFGLRHFLNLSLQLTGRGLVETHFLFQASGADRIHHTKDTDTIAVSSVLGHVKRDFDVTHRYRYGKISRVRSLKREQSNSKSSTGTV
jgi:hypothetical protein